MASFSYYLNFLREQNHAAALNSTLDEAHGSARKLLTFIKSNESVVNGFPTASDEYIQKINTVSLNKSSIDNLICSNTVSDLTDLDKVLKTLSTLDGGDVAHFNLKEFIQRTYQRTGFSDIEAVTTKAISLIESVNLYRNKLNPVLQKLESLIIGQRTFPKAQILPEHVSSANAILEQWQKVFDSDKIMALSDAALKLINNIEFDLKFRDKKNMKNVFIGVGSGVFALIVIFNFGAVIAMVTGLLKAIAIIAVIGILIGALSR